MKILSFPWKRTISEEKERPEGFGTFMGVYLPGVLCIFGIILFLRFGWIIGHAGFSTVFAVVTLGSLITLITVLSMSATVTNQRIGSGGTYYLISRAFGMEVGSAVGISLYITQVFTISFCALGFVESIQDFIPMINPKVLGVSSVLILFGLSFTSAQLVMKVQFYIFLIFVLSLLSLFLGGNVAFEPVTIKIEPLSFWAAFALFFPAVTGIEVSVSLSGSLKNPTRSIPIGSIAVVLTGYLVYIFAAKFLHESVPLEVLASDCKIMIKLARYQLLILLGIWTAALSSMLSIFVSAPRILQAIALDGVVPKIIGSGFGEKKEPHIACILTCIFALIGAYCGQIEQIASLMTMFLLVAYGMLNLASGIEGYLDTPSWRPTFRIPWVLSIFGAALCVVSMFMVDAGATFCALFFVIILYLIMRRRTFDTSLDDIRHGLLLFFARFATYRLAISKSSLRSWRPNFLVFVDDRGTHLQNLLLSAAISRGKSFLTMTSLNFDGQAEEFEIKKRWHRFLKNERIKALIEVCNTTEVTTGIKDYIASYGLGPLTPDTIVLNTEYQKKPIDLDEILEFIKKKKQNLIITSTPASTHWKKTKARIDIWWDEEKKENNDLMIALAYLYQKSTLWKRAHICIKSIVPDALLQQERVEKFDKFMKESRLQFTTEVYVSSSSDHLRLIEDSSKDASLTLIGIKNEEQLKIELSSTAFVFNGTSIDLHSIFN